MLIHESNGVFVLETENTHYVMAVDCTGVLGHEHWGRKCADIDDYKSTYTPWEKDSNHSARDYGKTEYLPYGGTCYRNPAFVATYGDNWIYLPDEQNRETHTSNMHPDIAYCNWLRDIRPAIDSDKALADFVTRKEWNVQKAIPAHEMQVIGYTQNALLTQMEFESDPKLSYSALAALSAPELLTRVDGYLRPQISGPYLKNDIYVRVPDETVALILRALLKQGEFARAGKLLAARAKQGALTEELTAVNEQFLTIRSLVRYFEDRYVDEGDVEPLIEMAPKLQAALTAYPDHLNLLRCELQYILLSAPADTDEAAARHAIATFPADTELAYWAGAVLERCGHADEAAALYPQAAATANGVILMYLNDKDLKGGVDHD